MGKHSRNQGNDPAVTIARIGLLGTLGAAVIATVTAITLAIVGSDKTPGTAGASTTATSGGSASTASTAPATQGAIDSVSIDQEAGTIMVVGRADGPVHTVMLTFGPTPKNDQMFWFTHTSPHGGRWRATINVTPPPFPAAGKLKALFDSNEYANPVDVDVTLKCVATEGPDCLGTHFGPPATYSP